MDKRGNKKFYSPAPTRACRAISWTLWALGTHLGHYLSRDKGRCAINLRAKIIILRPLFVWRWLHSVGFLLFFLFLLIFKAISFFFVCVLGGLLGYISILWMLGDEWGSEIPQELDVSLGILVFFLSFWG